MQDAVGKQAVPSPETRTQASRGGVELSPLVRWLALLPTYRPLGCTEEKEAINQQKGQTRRSPPAPPPLGQWLPSVGMA